MGFKRGLSSPCLFLHKSRDIETVVHGDDFTSLGPESELLWMARKLKEQLSIKERGILGPDINDTKEIRILTESSRGVLMESGTRPTSGMQRS